MAQAQQKRPGIVLRLVKISAVLAILWFVMEVVNASYADYIARSQMSEAVWLLGSTKEPLAKFLADKGRWPGQGDKVVQTGGGKYAERLDLAVEPGAGPGRVIVTATMKKTGVNLSLVGKTVEMSSIDGKAWICRSGRQDGVEPKFLPAACR